MTTQNTRQETEEKMWLLHTKLTEHFLSLLEKEDKMRASAYKEICDFLQQNGISLKERSVSRGIEYLLEELPFPGEDELPGGGQIQPVRALPPPIVWDDIDTLDLPFPDTQPQ
jgi:hypothetical protein